MSKNLEIEYWEKNTFMQNIEIELKPKLDYIQTGSIK